MRASKGTVVMRHLLSSKFFVSMLAVLISFALGAILIALGGASVGEAYFAMFRGAVFDPTAATTQRQIKPLTDSLFYAIPLIIGGLGLGFGFRAGLFNIGGQGQVILGAMAAVWVGFSMSLPPVLHTLFALFMAMLAGALYAGLAGLLKARTGANEVIVTIMLNSIAFLALGYALSQESWQVPGSKQPQTPNVASSAAFIKLLPAPFKLHAGIIVALLAVVVFWWLLDRSTIGLQVRAVGANPDAARTAGIPVGGITTLTMAISGAFLGLAGANEALGTIGYVSRGVAGSIGFDAITVALLGRNKPLGTLASGLLFGAFKAGGYTMQAKGVPVDMILILQSVIVLLIAAPALVRWLFRLPAPSRLSLRQELAALGAGAEGAGAQPMPAKQASADDRGSDASFEPKGEAR
nr:ABC transporter permease [Actinomyces trachealis]